MNKKFLDIDKKVLTKSLISFLETSIADEVILSSFIRKIKVLDYSDVYIHIGVDSLFAKEYLKENYLDNFSLAILEILEKKLAISFFQISTYKTEKKNNKNALFDSQKTNTVSRVDRSLVGVNKNFNFSNYVVTSFNEEVVKAGMAIIGTNGKYNPLFIHSSSGFGKSHFLHAIANKIIDKHNSVFFVSPNSFTSEVALAFSKTDNAVEKLKTKYSEVDYLLVDDIQLFSNRVKTMEVFFDIFNKRILDKKQMVFTSDKVFNELGGFEDRVISRFGNGLVLELKKPSVDDLKKIIKKKISLSPNLSKYKWKNSAIFFLARNINLSIRHLESLLIRVEFYLENVSTNIVIDEKLVTGFFKDVFVDETLITPEKIIYEVSKYYGISKSNILSKNRKNHMLLLVILPCFFVKK